MSAHFCKTCRPTFIEARKAIQEYLKGRGWTLSGDLKIPHATSTDGDVRFWFKPQAVWFTMKGPYAVGGHSFGNARSTHGDIRDMPAEQWVRQTMRWLGRLG